MVVVDSRDEQLVLVSGPSRGGKSRWAEHLLKSSPAVTYIATSARRPDDVDWQKRLQLHRERRPEHWVLLECEGDLVSALNEIEANSDVLIDSLGGFVAWHLEGLTTSGSVWWWDCWNGSPPCGVSACSWWKKPDGEWCQPRKLEECFGIDWVRWHNAGLSGFKKLVGPAGPCR